MKSIGDWFDRTIIGFILASVAVVILETEPALAEYSRLFLISNYVFAVVFTLEYLVRLYHARDWRYIFTPMAIIDLVALLPFYLMFFSDAFLLRLFRLARLLALAKLGRFSKAHRRILGALWGTRYELGVSFGLAFFAVTVAAAIMHMIEGAPHPEAFGSIPRAMWWGIETLTTIGYGEVYPITVAGKLFTAFYAVIAIGFVGMVSGIVVTSVLKSFKADQDGEYPTERDYAEFEEGYIEGVAYFNRHMGDQTPLRDSDNPYSLPADDPGKAICAFSGWNEGVRRAIENNRLQVKMSFDFIDKENLRDTVGQVERERRLKNGKKEVHK